MNKLTDFNSEADGRNQVRIAATAAQAREDALASMPLRADKAVMKYAFVAASIIIALSPSLFFSFGYHNDFNAFAYDTHRCCTSHPETRILMSIGRYFGAYAQNLQFWTIHRLTDFWWWRLVGILSTALLAAYYLHIVSRQRPPTWQNACLTVAVFTLPTMQFQSIWVSMYMFWTPPILLSLLAAQLLLTAAEYDVLVDRHAVRTAGPPMLSAFAALLAGVLFYPMSATFVLVPTAHVLLSENTPRARRMAVLAVATVGGSFAALFIIHKFIVLPHLSHVPYLGDYEFVLSTQMATDAAWRLSEYLQYTSFLWLGLDVSEVPELIALVAAVGAIWCAIRLLRGSMKTGELLNVLIVCALFVIAAGPLLIVRQFTLTYRVMFTMTAIELLVLFWLLKQLPFSAVAVASAFAAVGLASAFVSVYGTASSAHAEYALDARSVAGLSPKQFHPIIILRPPSARTAFGYELRDDFGWLSPIDHIFDLLIGRRYNGQASFDVETVEVNQDDTFPLVLEQRATVIDLSPVYGLPPVTDFSGFATVSAQPRGQSGPINAVNGRANTFWEVCKQPFPIALKVNYPSAHKLLGYELSTVDAPERMPSAWEILVTSDGQDWRRLHEVADAKPWTNREVRKFDVGPTPDVIGIKLVISASRSSSCMRLYQFRPIFEMPAG